MKKLIALLLALTMCFALVACGETVEVEPSKPAEAPAAPADAPDAPAAPAEPEYKLRMSTTFPEGTPAVEACNYFIDRVAELTDGRVAIELFPASSLGDYTATFGELINGTLDITWESKAASYSPKIMLASAPYLVSNWDEVKYAFNTESWLGQYLGQTYEELGVYQIGVMGTGFYGISGAGEADVANLFVPGHTKTELCRVPSNAVSIEVVKGLGYNPTVIAYSDLYSAMQTGVCDAFFGSDASNAYMAFRDVIDYFAAYAYLNEYLPLLVSGAVMDKLPADIQDALRQAGAEATTVANDLYRASEEEYYKMMEEDGITVIKPTDEELAAMVEYVRNFVYPQVEELTGIENAGELLFDYVEEMQAALAD